MKTLEAPFFAELFRQSSPILDVRAPMEFLDSHVPGSTNLSLLNNEERALIGTTYKLKGREAALELGYQLVSGPLRDERVEQWVVF